MSYFRPGDHKIICERSGFATKRSNCRWEFRNGKRTILVDKRFWIADNPQSTPPHVPKPTIPDYTNPATYVFVDTNEVTADDL